MYIYISIHDLISIPSICDIYVTYLYRDVLVLVKFSRGHIKLDLYRTCLEFIDTVHVFMYDKTNNFQAEL